MSAGAVHLCLLLLLTANFFQFAKSDLAAIDSEIELQSKDSNFEEVFKHAVTTCKIKERASDYDVENVLNNFLPSTMTEKCFVACWLESFHVIKNRRFYIDQYIKLSSYGQNLNGQMKNTLRQILQTCKLHDNCKQDRCELAYRIMKCIYDGAVKLNIDPRTL